MNERGFTLLEFLIAGVLAAVVAGVATFGFRNSQRVMGQNQIKGGMEIETLEALQHLRRVGRVAQRCEKKGAAPAFQLECSVAYDPNSPGTFTTVRFLVVAGALEFQKEDPTAGAWTTLLKYQGISELVLCNDGDMATGTCSLLPQKLNEVSTSSASVARANRYYRYGLVAKGAGPLRETKTEYQGAFFVRNPGPFGPNTFYQYGG